jgi:hypothetical protein
MGKVRTAGKRFAKTLKLPAETPATEEFAKSAAKSADDVFAEARKHRVLYANDSVIVHDEGKERVVTVAVGDSAKQVRFDRDALLKSSIDVDAAFEKLVAEGPDKERVKGLLDQARPALKVAGA